MTAKDQAHNCDQWKTVEGMRANAAKSRIRWLDAVHSVYPHDTAGVANTGTPA